jgi:hypothetical protein
VHFEMACRSEMECVQGCARATLRYSANQQVGGPLTVDDLNLDSRLSKVGFDSLPILLAAGKRFRRFRDQPGRLACVSPWEQSVSVTAEYMTYASRPIDTFDTVQETCGFSARIGKENEAAICEMRAWIMGGAAERDAAIGSGASGPANCTRWGQNHPRTYLLNQSIVRCQARSAAALLYRSGVASQLKPCPAPG